MPIKLNNVAFNDGGTAKYNNTSLGAIKYGSTTVWQSKIPSAIFANGAWGSHVTRHTIIAGRLINLANWAFAVNSGGDSPVINASGIKLSWWANGQYNNGYIIYLNSFNFTGYTRVVVQYQKLSNGYYPSGGAHDGSATYFTFALSDSNDIPLTAVTGATFAKKFAKVEMTRSLNTRTWAQFTIGSGQRGYLYISPMTNSSASGSVLIERIYLK